MSTHISVSSLEENHCKKLLEKFKKVGINCRTIETFSVVGGKIENGCMVTFGYPYNNKENIKTIWNIMKDDYNCGHLEIGGVYNGCVYNYIKSDFCSES